MIDVDRHELSIAKSKVFRYETESSRDDLPQIVFAIHFLLLPELRNCNVADMPSGVSEFTDHKIKILGRIKNLPSQHRTSHSGFPDAAFPIFLQSIWIAYGGVKPNSTRYFFLFDISKSETPGQVPRKKCTTLACGNWIACKQRQGRQSTTRKGFRRMMSCARHILCVIRQCLRSTKAD
ncbi:hypothetical protein [Herbaspirillum sp. CF444]|uniref:hypothetical protein n=1 Tax=Herbaspirillum sp. CF444 TaxID=1144319 RepID=UPI00138B1448|nr:hypothetical protein [Herbaspirillum sp. CF444]